jgi:hypothetical protein
MYLFSRRRQANPAKLRQALGVATEATTRVHQITGRELAAWTAIFSPDAGTVVWSTFAEHLEELTTSMDKLGVDSGFQDWVEANDACFVGPTHDSLVQFVHGGPGGERPEFAATVRARCAAGHLADGVLKGVELAQGYQERTGLATAFGTVQTGGYGGVMWIVGAADVAAIEQADATLAADAGWVELLDSVGSLYETDTTTTMFRRLA